MSTAPAEQEADVTIASAFPGHVAKMLEARSPDAGSVESVTANTSPRGAPLIRSFARTSAALALLIGAFALDTVSGNEVSSSLFYVIGIGVAAWFVGKRAAIVFAFLSTAAWGISVHLAGPGFSRPSVLLWNLGVELAIYLTIAVALDRVHLGILHERRLFDQLAIAKGDLDRETQAVGVLQREMLPTSPPEVPGYEWEIHYATSSRAGGDYYDFFALPGGRIGILLGDASGHGAQATVLMAMMRAVLHTTTDVLRSPERVLQQLGNQIAQIVPVGRFATACYAVLEPSSGGIDFSLAGHPAPLLLRGDDGSLEELPLRGGPPLGLFTQSLFEAGAVTLRPGDTLVLFTDGLTEGMSPTRELFGDDRLREALLGGKSLPLVGLRDRLLARFEAHRAGAALEDDLTVLMLRRTRQ